MKITHLLTTVASMLVLANINVAQANNGLVYPPADNSRIYQYPPTMPAAPMSQGSPYTFGQPNTQMPVPMAPQRMPMQRNTPSHMPSANNNFPAFPRNNNGRQSLPFGNNNMMPFNNFGGNNFNPFSGSNMPFGNNSGNNFNPFSGGKMPFANNSGNGFGMPSNPMNNMFGNNGNNNSMPFFGNNNGNSFPFFGNNSNKNRKKAWGDKRNIWPDFYTDFTDEAWDTMSSGPRDLGRMPGGWRFPHISTPDPVTVSDAITNQFPPIAEEAGNMMDFSDWGVFDNN